MRQSSRFIAVPLSGELPEQTRGPLRPNALGLCASPVTPMSTIAVTKNYANTRAEGFRREVPMVAVGEDRVCRRTGHQGEAWTWQMWAPPGWSGKGLPTCKPSAELLDCLSMKDVQYRSAGPEDFTFLATMLREAAVWRPNKPTPTGDQVLADPRDSMYLAEWPRPGDDGLIAEQDAPVGAAWHRMYTEASHGYGFVAGDIPELAIAVFAVVSARGDWSSAPGRPHQRQ